MENPNRGGMEIDDEGIVNLANGIIAQAADDYRHARRKLAKKPGDLEALKNLRSIERFFHSDWYKALTLVPGTELLRRLKLEMNEELKGHDLYMGT